MNLQTTFYVLRALIIGLWPISVLAAGDSLGSTLGSITYSDWISLVLLSSVSGLVALLHRIRKSFEALVGQQAGEILPPELHIGNWKLFSAVHMTGAMFVGTIAFLLCEAGDINHYLESATIALSSWSGAKLADKWADAVGERLSNVIGTSNGGTR